MTTTHDQLIKWNKPEGARATEIDPVNQHLQRIIYDCWQQIKDLSHGDKRRVISSLTSRTDHIRGQEILAERQQRKEATGNIKKEDL